MMTVYLENNVYLQSTFAKLHSSNPGCMLNAEVAGRAYQSLDQEKLI